MAKDDLAKTASKGESDLAQTASKGESDLEDSQNGPTRAVSRPTFLGRAHGCVSGIWGPLVVGLTIV
jgi:hypothetical protein